MDKRPQLEFNTQDDNSAQFVIGWVHIQTIEMFWVDLKEVIKRKRVNKKLIKTCIDTFLLKNIRKTHYTT